jgi:hypothetical protein
MAPEFEQLEREVEKTTDGWLATYRRWPVWFILGIFAAMLIAWR